MTTQTPTEDYLCLKWGTLKHWEFHSKEAKKLLKEYEKIGFASGGRMLQVDTPRQKEIICKLINIGNFKKDKVYLDWTNKYVSKDKAKKYVLNYDKEKYK